MPGPVWLTRDTANEGSGFAFQAFVLTAWWERRNEVKIQNGFAANAAVLCNKILGLISTSPTPKLLQFFSRPCNLVYHAS